MKEESFDLFPNRYKEFLDNEILDFGMDYWKWLGNPE